MLFLIFLLFVSVNSYFIGSSTSSYQIEGHQPGISIWDKFTKTHNLEPVGNATNHYLMYKEDVKLMYDLNFRNYRLSISWTRIMPYKWNEINQEGIQFYHNLLDELKLHNITPYVTLYHWDLPNYLQEEFGGWSNPSVVEYFLNYSKIIFNEYDNKVNYWITINEPLTTSVQGYGDGSFAPGIKSENEKYLSGHYQLLAHAYCAAYYKENYNGKIGIAINSNWFEPFGSNSSDKAFNYLMNSLGWFADPLFFGEYPKELNCKILNFTDYEKMLLINSLDFFGLNHYTTYYVNSNGEISHDSLWIQGESEWLYSVPYGINRILNFINNRYGSIPIYITECGFSMKNDKYYDTDRIHYLFGYLYDTLKSIKEGVNVKGFFIWSLLDNFEWISGYNETFGIIQVNRTNYARKPKKSAELLSSLITI
jgi:beta-glucosidase